MPEPAGDPATLDDAARVVEQEMLPRVAELVNATLGVGAAMARTLAQATTSTTLPPTSDAPLQDVVRFGATAAGNLLGMAVDGARVGARTATPRAGREAPASTGTSASPQVTAGSTLRVPLLVENAGQTPTPPVPFAVVDLRRVDDGAAIGADGGLATGQGLTGDQVSFSPTSLVIGPRDFEKLTVRVATADDTVPGRYRVVVDGGNGWFSTTIEFSVVTAG